MCTYTHRRFCLICAHTHIEDFVRYVHIHTSTILFDMCTYTHRRFCLICAHTHIEDFVWYVHIHTSTLGGTGTQTNWKAVELILLNDCFLLCGLSPGQKIILCMPIEGNSLPRMMLVPVHVVASGMGFTKRIWRKAKPMCTSRKIRPQIQSIWQSNKVLVCSINCRFCEAFWLPVKQCSLAVVEKSFAYNQIKHSQFLAKLTFFA